MSADPEADGPVRIHRTGISGWITLNRPRSINALTHAMVRRIDMALTEWEDRDQVVAVVLDGAGERGLCAGGDIRAIRESSLLDGAAARDFWRDEYRLNARIASYRKPWVALMDGIVMGGGVGLSGHGSVRVVTERSQVAMPEVAIGFVPDVGGTYLLSRAPGELGTHLALTARSMSAGDALWCGFADHFVPTAVLPDFRAALAESEPAGALLAFAAEPPAAGLAEHREWIDACYAADSVPEIVDRLYSCGEPQAKEAAERILTHSPTAVSVTLRALRRARDARSLPEVLDQDFRVSSAALSGPDLAEGVRAQVVDKDRSPRWSPATLQEVSEADVERYFAQVRQPLSLTPTSR
ncbi:enoyl-CoA hydratase/isomerase family protein [Streptomyces sp. NPDC006879]|uniref:enoyl-CoA hydratase/isomerase family protein n=1 Tax=Streptomyces sp. NPDC006879 TaxID=3364767 RepID=UPI003687FB24